MTDDSNSPFDILLMLLSLMRRIADFISVYFPNISGKGDFEDKDSVGTYGI